MRGSEWGYPSKEPCEVCEGFNLNQYEPRFLYTVCLDHQGVPPVDIAGFRFKRSEEK